MAPFEIEIRRTAGRKFEIATWFDIIIEIASNISLLTRTSLLYDKYDRIFVHRNDISRNTQLKHLSKILILHIFIVLLVVKNF